LSVRKDVLKITDKDALLEEIEANIWDDSEEVFSTIRNLLNVRTWWWSRNSKCKYVSVRIDMRDGNCILSDRNGKRISVEDLKYQCGDSK